MKLRDSRPVTLSIMPVFGLQLCMFLLLLISLSPLHWALLQKDQYDALEGIYESLGGPKWHVYSNEVAWNFDVGQEVSDPCINNWFGEC